MKVVNPQELHVSIDIGCYFHSVAVGLANGTYLGKFEISHNKRGFKKFFNQIEEFKKQSNGEVYKGLVYKGQSSIKKTNQD